jgi:hypothetical protein
MGKKTAGKSTVADLLKLESGQYEMVDILAFANPLKRAVKELFLFSDNQLYGDQKEVIDERWGVSPRQVMQLLGTEFCRDRISPDFWTKRMRFEIASSEYPVIIIDDVRFENEAEMCDYVVLVERSGLSSKDEHRSEQIPYGHADDLLYNPGDSIPNLRKIVEGSEVLLRIKEALVHGAD